MRLTAHSYSPSVLGKIIRSGARESSFEEATKALGDLAELTIGSRQVGRIAREGGRQLQARRDDHVARSQAGELSPRVETRPALAVVEVDGGRLRIRGPGEGPGAHDASWREDKIAMPATAAITASDDDPEPELPACFRDRGYVEKLVRGIGGPSAMSPPDPPDEGPADTPDTACDPPGPARKKPELPARTYVASTRGSDEFGPMVAEEARRRNFLKAAARAFVGDGAAWIWKLQRRYFPGFVAIVDFLHVLGHLFAAAKAAPSGVEGPWGLFQARTEACWRGQVGRVIEAIGASVDGWGPMSEAEVEGLADDDPRKILIQELGYLERNRERMDYPGYRRQGLPWTSSHVESTVKLFNRRVKGTEKSWDEAGAEAILQLRAAYLSEDGRLDEYLKSRASSPFRTYKVREDRQAA